MTEKLVSLCMKTAGIALALCTLATLSAQEPPSAYPFDYAVLKGKAKALSETDYQPRPAVQIPEIKRLDYDLYQHIDFQDDHALWANDRSNFRIQFFHLGLYFLKSVTINELKDGYAQPIAFDPAMFFYGKSKVDGDKLPQNLGFAGFRINFKEDWDRDIAAFLGASYFRAVGFDWQYGLSARGLAIDSGLPTGEEFPDFTEFWLEKPAPKSDTLVLYALLDSPRVTGAYRIAITPGETLLMEVDSALYPRETLTHAGIAPLTSMFQFAENDRRQGVSDDWRPEIHDSDGLSIWNGNYEWIWRPLTNPPYLRINAFVDQAPKGFGLMQRDRNFDHYQDDAVFYDKRPSLWVEPKGDWGPGAVSLLEIPTVDETFDNIVAAWIPATPLEPGNEYRFAYRLYWGTNTPIVPELAQVVATRTGKGGNIGQQNDYFSRRFVIDFEGEILDQLDAEAPIDTVIDVSAGHAENVHAYHIRGQKGVRVAFDLVPDPEHKPMDVRLFIRSGDETLSETFLYNYIPTAQP